MINILKEYYKINITEYQTYNNGIIFFINSYYYYLTPCDFSEIQLIELNRFIQSLKKVQLHSFIFNKYNQILSDKYVLLRINTIIENITINDILTFNKINMDKNINSYLYMDEIWYKKIDYLEYQLIELSNNKLINNSFDYFVGLSESILKYYKNNYIKNDKLVLSHLSLTSLSTIDFYNPLTISYDNYLKDLSSYIKLTKDYNYLLNLLDKINDNDKKYLFVRIIFPFSYFNEIESIIIEKKTNSHLIDIVNNVNKYEEFVSHMQKMFGINLFPWIKKE